jgi:hypothetical protein
MYVEKPGTTQYLPICACKQNPGVQTLYPSNSLKFLGYIGAYIYYDSFLITFLESSIFSRIRWEFFSLLLDVEFFVVFWYFIRCRSPAVRHTLRIPYLGHDDAEKEIYTSRNETSYSVVLRVHAVSSHSICHCWTPGLVKLPQRRKLAAFAGLYHIYKFAVSS